MIILTNLVNTSNKNNPTYLCTFQESQLQKMRLATQKSVLPDVNNVTGRFLSLNRTRF